MAVSLNVDLGELPGEPEELYSIATMVNVACGGHAGDEATMERACELARRAGARLAAHPSYPDRAGFGRTSVVMTSAELASSVRSQVEALARVALRVGISIEAVKPHGALYHDAARDPAIATAVVEGIEAGLGFPVALMGPPEGALARLATIERRAYLREGFADRAYGPDGKLVPRTQAGALITDPAAARAQALRLAGAGTFETLCVHGDTPGALTIARAVREGLESAGLLETRGRA
ncbi:LamB/YcsF family protein [Polyangium jinanense]|uniref:LamB/YcsF family protein n=1 Tax=Polyangium jinanense TaxID=2829994 RepID=A0A9X3X2D7_9BACT|nr:LamB/YcsF family protein [Polyangium jinanense]MDC3981028.1 LamB/YcsF family protein [Polyangium jinanense]